MNYKGTISPKYTKYPNLSTFDKIELPISYDLSSEDDILGTKLNEENINDKMNSEYTINKIEDKNEKNNINYNQNKITNFNFSLINPKINANLVLESIPKKKDKKINKILKKRGRKRKRSDISEYENKEDKKSHDRYSDDNMRKKCKNIILKYALEFINKKIKERYKGGIGCGKLKKQLKILNQQEKVNSTVNIEKTFLNKTLKEIFSENISARFNNYPLTYNKTLIESLINEKDEENKQFFQKLFNVTFLDCLNYFFDEQNHKEELDGFTKIIDIKETLKEKYGKNYVDLLIYYLENFQDIINNKKGRKTKKKDCSNAQKEYKV